MIDGIYDIAVDTPKLHRRGMLSLKSEGGAIVGILSVGEDVHEERFEGSCTDKEFTFEGSGSFPSLGEIDYVAHGSIWGNSLDVSIQTNKGTITFFGTQVGSSAGATTSSHDYLMKAAQGDFSDESTMYSGLFSDGS